jgi:light-regulated signal transduction histidine kinase (bacteriophytochrome)
MVTSFTQLLERRYKGQLDNEADDYIEFIVEGAHRMKYLIDDLLAFSRLNTQAKELESVELENVIDDVLSNLSVTIKENKACITYDPLPTVNADKTQMMQVFQNLIANAIKFQGSNPPKIHISAHKDEKEWKFAVTDNGIGIDPEYQKQIFEVFKRLHTREEYPGSGIGLSVSQKIIRRHGGNIWVESELGKGSTFYFTIPHSINDHPNFI